MRAGRGEEARRKLDFCLWVWPRSSAVHLLAARSARLRGDFADAEAHLNLCKKIEGGATKAIQVEFLLMRVQRGEEDEVAQELMLAAQDGYPEAALIYETLARAYMQYLRFGPAFSCLTLWIEVAPDDPEPLRWRAWVLERLNSITEAMNDYKRALKLDPTLVPVRLRLAELFLETSNPPEAFPLLDGLRKQFPDRADVMARMGQCKFLQGQAEEARQLLEAAVEQLPRDSAVLNTLAKLNLQEKQPAEAEKWLRRALKVDPTDTEAEFTLVATLQGQERWEEAKAALKQYQKDAATLRRVSKVLQQEAEKPSTDPDSLCEIGTMFLRTNERVGLYWLQKALERDPGHQAAHKALAEYFESKGDTESAATHRHQLKPEGGAASGPSKPTTPSRQSGEPPVAEGGAAVGPPRPPSP
jgi:tetratricopeptide (TPR) repeat protein